MSDRAEFQTPMMQQYIEVKSRYQDAILFFRMGDFYEMFLEDAQIGSRVLGITLTARNKGKDGSIPMAGVPFHSAEGYINRLVKNGYKVAICEQMTPSDTSNELVARDVIRVVTPSTNLSEEDTVDASPKYLMTFNIHGTNLGICLIGMRTGEVLVSEEVLKGEREVYEKAEQVLTEYIIRYQPAEILMPLSWYSQSKILDRFRKFGIGLFPSPEEKISYKQSQDFILQQYKISNLESFMLDHQETAVCALAIGLKYLSTTQKTEMDFLKPPRLLVSQDHLFLAGQTIRNLEILNNSRTGDTSTSLYGVLNRTFTPMGRRRLKIWLIRPLLNQKQIEQRWEVVAGLLNNPNLASSIRSELEGISDLEKALSRLAVKVGTARDLIGIKNGIEKGIELLKLIQKETSQLEMFTTYGKEINIPNLEELLQILNRAVNPEPPISLTDGGIIQPGYSAELDELRDIASGGRDWIKQLEERERQRTQISNLKIGFNRVFGFFIEISKTHAMKVPAEYIRRQTLANAERYIIPELKEFEEKVLQAQDKSNQLEQAIYRELVQLTLNQTRVIQSLCDFIATLDVLRGFAELASEQQYVQPVIVDGLDLEIKEGRHPVIEQLIGSSFVPNNTDIHYKPENPEIGDRFIVITGANMAGKSTYIRQIALLVIMAQIGCFVPAEKMQFGLVDQIHSRIGAMDDLAAGLSTFMVEMTETANVLANLTNRSLVILDEVGRGTNTYDGFALAWAISEYLLKESTAKVLFATHYLELTKLSENFPEEVVNYHPAVSERQDNVVFLYRIKPGVASRSYGIVVAQKAGLPKSVTQRANEILQHLERHNPAGLSLSKRQLSLF